MIGHSFNDKEIALMIKDVSVTLTPYFFKAGSLSAFWRANKSVTSISSPRAMKGCCIAETMDLIIPLPTLSVISTFLSSKVRGTCANVGVGAAATGAAAEGAASGALTAAKTSSANTRPPAPVPVTVFKLMPFSRANPRTFGVAKTPGALTAAEDEAVTEGAGVGVEATAGAGVGVVGAAGVATGAAPAVSISTRVSPTFTVSPVL
mmetsp:Transcript_87134/g.137515  ORF Transcript_87134/g.137515 Transcript_87134/m.137515 type:complete len:206 (-) Transcript_87134:52-669(-)